MSAALIDVRAEGIVAGRRRSRLTRFITYAAILAVVAWTVKAIVIVDTDWSRILTGSLLTTLGRFLELDWSLLPDLWEPALESVLMATLATLAGLVLSIPVAWLGASNITPFGTTSYAIGRFLMTMSRSVHEIVWGLIFVSAVGLGALAGILAMAVRSVGFISKTIAEAIEDVDPKPLEAIRAAGGNKFQILWYAILPQIIPVFVGNMIFEWDINIRRSTILGLVGAGGLGLVLFRQMAMSNNGGIAVVSGHFAELVALLATGKPFTPARVKPLIAVPTTAGTGSEVTRWATVWDRTPGAQKKYSLNLKETWPEAAVVDPELTLSLPAGPTLAAGLDALSHSLESIWNVNSNPISDTLAIAAAREVLATLPALMKDLGNPALRSRMSLAALQAGLAFSNTMTALAHSISYDMTLNHGLPHGIACSFTLPMVLRRAVGVDAGRDAVLAQIFDCPLDQAPALLDGFLGTVGVKTDFASYGVGKEEADQMIHKALDGVRGKNFIGAAKAA